VNNFGFEVEIEVPERRTVGLEDDDDQTLFLAETAEEIAPSCTFTLEVADVEAKYLELSTKGVTFEKVPQKLYWGYGAEVRDPDGYLVSVWDARSMRGWQLTAAW
jgi:uncharacterized glyoxalase superfamily protein PhnB